MTPHQRRRGFTLVELLVVASILAVLFGLLLAGGRSDPRSSIRRAAQAFASQLLSAQSRALGKTEGAAVTVEAAADNGRIGKVLHDSIMLPPIVVGVDNGQLQATPEDLASGYKIRFSASEGNGRLPVSPWLGLEDGQPSRRESAGQTPENTLLAPAADLDALIVRYPVTGGDLTTLAPRLGIDLKHSGVGDDPAASHGFGTLEGKSPIAVVLDQTGRVAELISQVGATGDMATEPLVPHEPIYFLFADREAVEQDLSLTSDKSIWVAINPQTGRINVSANQPSSTLEAAREKARQAIDVGK